MFSGPSLIGENVHVMAENQLRYFMNNPVMKSPFVRYGSLVLAVVLIFRVMPSDPNASMTTTDLLTYGLWWVLIAFLVSFLRPPSPLPPRGGVKDPAEPAAAPSLEPSDDEDSEELKPQ